MSLESDCADVQLRMSVRIPSPPPLLDQLSAILAKPDVEIEAFERLIQKDAGLTASIYRVLASPIFRLQRPPETLSQAISYIGVDALLELVRALSLQAALYGKSPFYSWFWERANEIADYAELIAERQSSVCNIFPEHAHLCALFAECGVPILIQHNPEYEKLFTTPTGYLWPDLSKEDSQFDTDHAVVGYLAAKHWHLPPFVCEAIRWQNDPINVNDQAATMIAIIQVATHIYNIRNSKDDSAWDRLRKLALEELGIAREDLDEFVEDILERASGL